LRETVIYTLSATFLVKFPILTGCYRHFHCSVNCAKKNSLGLKDVNLFPDRGPAAQHSEIENIAVAYPSCRFRQVFRRENFHGPEMREATQTSPMRAAIMLSARPISQKGG
jgi:hypothetical protein